MVIATKFRLNSAFKQLMSVHWWMAGVYLGLHFWLSYTFLAFVVLHSIEQRKVVRANWRRLGQFLKSKFNPA
jgi:hypothetical protein